MINEVVFMKAKFEKLLSKHYSSTMFTYKEIFGMLFPLILDMFFINAINMLTTSMISSSGQDSVAAVSMISPVTTLMICMINAIAAGGTVVVAQYKGRQDENMILKAAGHTLSVTVLISFICNMLLIVFASPVVNFLFGNAEPAVLEKSILYLAGVSLSSIILSVYTGVFSVFRGLGENKICLNLTIIINVSYFVLSFIFINLLHMDIIGTILGLILARLLGASVSLWHLFFKKTRLLSLRVRDVFHFNGKLFQSMLKISIPFGSEQFFFYGGSIIAQKIIVELGTDIVASNAIANSLFALVFAAPMAVGNLATTVIGQCVGAGKRDVARWYGKKLVRMGTILVTLSILVFLPFTPLLLSLYKPAAETLPLIYRLLLIAAVPMPFFWSMSNVMPYVLRSAGDAVYSSVISLVTMWVIRVGAGYILAIPLGLGIEGIWVCMSLEWIIRFFLFYFRYRGKKWLTKNTI